MEITFTLDSLEKANLVLQGLGELPAKLSIGLIQELQAQAKTQISAEQNVQEKGDQQ